MLFQKGFELKRTAKMGIWDLLFKQIWFEGKINLFLFLIILDDFIFLPQWKNWTVAVASMQSHYHHLEWSAKGRQSLGRQSGQHSIEFAVMVMRVQRLWGGQTASHLTQEDIRKEEIRLRV